MADAAGQDDAYPYSSMAGRLDAGLLQSLEAMQFTTMTPVQHKVLTELPDWRSDCLVQAKTGTGKTLAFLLPSLHFLLENRNRARSQVAILVITPTRELAQQIAVQCDQLTAKTTRRLECHVAVGGTARPSAFSAFTRGDPAILVATPGRLLDYLSDNQCANKFKSLQTLVLDEADTMLESGFLPDVKRVLSLLPTKSTGWQGMCFSATVPNAVRDVVNIVLNKGYSNITTVDPNETPTHERVPQYLVRMPDVAATVPTLAALLDLESKTNPKIIVFGITANIVALFARAFQQSLTGLQVFEIHSRLSQSARTRTTSEFKDARAGVMFASDVVGRGMDFPNVDLVVQVGLPSSSDQYIHRVGRTARAGNDGRAVILLTPADTYFVTSNRQLPIKDHPEQASIDQLASTFGPIVTNVMNKIDATVKQRAYSSYIGFFSGSGHLRKMRLDKTGLVQLANGLAIDGMACVEPPCMERSTVGKMGMKGIPGFNFGEIEKPGVLHNGGINKPRKDGGGGSTRGRPGHGRGDQNSGTSRSRGGGGRGGRGGQRGGRGGQSA